MRSLDLTSSTRREMPPTSTASPSPPSASSFASVLASGDPDSLMMLLRSPPSPSRSSRPSSFPEEQPRTRSKVAISPASIRYPLTRAGRPGRLPPRHRPDRPPLKLSISNSFVVSPTHSCRVPTPQRIVSEAARDGKRPRAYGSSYATEFEEAPLVQVGLGSEVGEAEEDKGGTCDRRGVLKVDEGAGKHPKRHVERRYEEGLRLEERAELTETTRGGARPPRSPSRRSIAAARKPP